MSFMCSVSSFLLLLSSVNLDLVPLQELHIQKIFYFEGKKKIEFVLTHVALVQINFNFSKICL